MADEKLYRIGRRAALKRLATAAGAPALAAAAPAAAQTAKGKRDPLDPDLMNAEPHWGKLLSAEERRTLAALCDLIIPADGRSPSASKVGVPDFIDEWVSAPYPKQEADRQVVRGGIGWINTESHKRFGKPFAEVAPAQQQQICADVADPRKARPRFKIGAAFFHKVRHLTIAGFYTTLEGMKDVQYVGNVPSATFEGPPPAALAHLKRRRG